ncbi:metal ABC transporter substrate-binding protein [Natronorubrum halophilum]|uniref:metal ABC transporter substrate-binding protein n=1 Tax=Natronorubrum halophilum TaxID=1702106 RepID=UPI000EF659A4|nr:zinc ABC transporter substrate-binding protein [Natronorubrum halophilum]
MNSTRRSLLQGGAGILATSVFAGCLDDVGRNGEFDSGYAAFFTLWDWSQQVSGDAIDFENPVGTGEAGHGWQPSGDLTRDIADTGAFVYLDTPEFSWAQDVAATLEDDYDTVAVIDALDGLDDQLLDWGHEVDNGDHEDHGDHDHEDDENDSHEGDHEDHDHENDSHEDHDHDRSSNDPHVWLDPVLAQDVIDNIVDGLADADPDNAETFEDNAAEYATHLEELDGQFEELIAEADRHVAVLAGHDSFTYLEERYGFELHTPIGVSPQEEPSHGDISDTIDLIDEEGIDTILYDAFDAPEGEVPPLVDTILGGSDATDAVAVSPAAGTLESWQEEGWGYREQMEEINIPAFREALGTQ